MTAPPALFHRFPHLEQRLPWVRLGDYPTAVEQLDRLSELLGSAPIWVKREDRSNARFGGNKVRTLESLFGEARAQGADRIWATGAYGSNHACAMAMHAGTAGLASGALLFPQPPTDTAIANFLAIAATDCEIHRLFNVVSLPFAMAATRALARRRGERAYVMSPGGATPRGALAHVSAALELAGQIEAGECPPPRRIVITVGSTCTTAGMLVGLRLAERMGIGFGTGRAPAPRVTAVRVTPWPITGATNIALLAYRTSKLLASLVGNVGAFSFAELRSLLRAEHRFFGGSYGKPTAAGAEARQLFDRAGGPPLDQVYTEKAGAALVHIARRGAPGPLLFWASRSSAPLPTPTDAQLARVPRGIRRWLDKPRIEA